MKVKEIKYGDPWPENLHWSGDPVRPELSREFRQSVGREVYTNDGAVICVAYCDEVPKTVKDLDEMNGLKYVIFYTVWSKKPGHGRMLVLDTFKHLSFTKSWLEGFYTLSPKTKMAWNFHIQNGARMYRENETSDNYEYDAAELQRK